MAPQENRRNALVDKLADYVLAQGLADASLRPLAKAVGTSDRMLLYYFADKSEMMAAVLARIAERMTLKLAERAAPQPLICDALLPRIADIVLADAFWPYMAVWLELASRAARQDAVYLPIAHMIGQGFLYWAAQQLEATDDDQRMRDAARLLVQIEGMVVLKAIGLAGTGQASLPVVSIP
jgi:AcrR family transcriptional regulator